MTIFRRVRHSLTWILIITIAISLGLIIEASADGRELLLARVCQSADLIGLQAPFKERSFWGLKSIEAEKSKELAKRLPPILVAIIDTGADVYHPDLIKRIWKNPGETGRDYFGRDKSTNGVDDDKNGFVDDVSGWNFVSNNSNLIDHHGHGTHIAGIVAGEKSGVAPNSQVMILKYYDPASPPHDTLKNTIRAIDYAVLMGAKIINFSAGGRERSALEELTIQRASSQGVLFVAAAGNDHRNTDLKTFYPAGYEIENILSVAAIDESSHLLDVSNFGAKSVDLAAPGGLIYSTFPGGRYEALSGTSQATAFATGAAALLLSANPKETPVEVIRKLASTGLPNHYLIGKTKYQVQLNSFRALAMKDESESAEGVQVENKRLFSQLAFSSTSMRKVIPSPSPNLGNRKKRTKIALKE